MACERYTGGHINDTYFATYDVGGQTRRYVHQRINTKVFRDAHALMHNVGVVTRHIREKLERARVPDIDRRVLQVIPTTGGSGLLERGGEYWRTYAYVTGTSSRLRVHDAGEAYAAAKAFGEFSGMLCDLPPSQLRDTIPAFHDTPARYAALGEALAADVCARAGRARDAVAQAGALSGLAHALNDLAASNALGLRAVHNDTKITNVLFELQSSDAVCVVDLDTVMPGLALFDAGEMVRTGCTHAPEDEPDPAAVTVDETFLDAVLAGFADGARDTIVHAERAAFVTAGRVLAFENGVRFLTDYLNGDVYFRVHRQEQNLDRARAQFALALALAPYEGRIPR